MPSEPFLFEMDNMDSATWDQLITQFEDASIYQSWAFGKSATRFASASHIVMKEGCEVYGCCQVRLKRLYPLKIGVADINWGPLCRRKGKSFEPQVLAEFLRKIIMEYGRKRGYLLRITPKTTRDTKQLFKNILECEGFLPNIKERPYRTFLMDLSPPLEELRLNLLQKWRNCLNRAEQNNLIIKEGTTNELFDRFIRLADEMCERKKISIGVDYRGYQRIQENLPEHLKMRIMVCEFNGISIGAIVCSTIGNTGIYLLGATAQEGLKLNCSYLLQWRMIQWMKEHGINYYDLGAFNPQLNPGVYHFKKGLAGKTENEEIFLNEYKGCFNLRGWIANTLTIRQKVGVFYEALKNRIIIKEPID